MTRVRALLANAPGLPDGHVEHGLDLDLILTPQGQVDYAAWLADPDPWPARRYWPDRDDWRGELIRVDETWALRTARGDNEPLWDFSARVLRPGEYVTLRRPDGEALVFRIVSVG